MSAHKGNQPLTSEVEQPIRADHGGDQAITLGYWPLSKPLPLLLTDTQLRLVLGISNGQFYKLKALGHFRRLETPLQLTTRTRYCGALVTSFARGTWTHARTFGAKRGLRVSSERRQVTSPVHAPSLSGLEEAR